MVKALWAQWGGPAGSEVTHWCDTKGCPVAEGALCGLNPSPVCTSSACFLSGNNLDPKVVVRVSESLPADVRSLLAASAQGQGESVTGAVAAGSEELYIMGLRRCGQPLGMEGPGQDPEGEGGRGWPRALGGCSGGQQTQLADAEGAGVGGEVSSIYLGSIGSGARVVDGATQLLGGI